MRHTHPTSQALLVAQLGVLPTNLVECLLQLVAPTDSGELRLLLVAQARIALSRHEAFRGNRSTFHRRKCNSRARELRSRADRIRDHAILAGRPLHDLTAPTGLRLLLRAYNGADRVRRLCLNR